MSFGDWFCVSRKDGTGGGGLIRSKDENRTAPCLGLAVKVPPKCVEVQVLSVHSPDYVFTVPVSIFICKTQINSLFYSHF